MIHVFSAFVGSITTLALLGPALAVSPWFIYWVLN